MQIAKIVEMNDRSMFSRAVERTWTDETLYTIFSFVLITDKTEYWYNIHTNSHNLKCFKSVRLYSEYLRKRAKVRTTKLT